MAKVEKWRDIIGFNGLYQVSTMGRVRSLDRVELQKNGIKRKRKGRIMVLSRKRTGYLSAHLSKDCKTFDLNVHRLVAMAFIPNPKNLPCINHKDGNRENNEVDNLEWCTYLYNNTYDNARVRAALARKRVIQRFTLDGELIAEYRTVNYAASQLGFPHSRLHAIMQKGGGIYRGCFWKFKERE